MAKPPPSAVDNVVSLAKRRGFVFPCGEIYGGTRSAWDYGPLGVELKENIKRQWWRSMVQSREDVVGLDSSVILPRQTWEASGHVATFTDPLTECQSCHKRFRADHLQEEAAEKKGGAGRPRHGRPSTCACPNCGTRGAWTEPRQFSGLLKTYLGVDRGRVRPALPAPRDRAGHLLELRQRGDQLASQAAVRHRPDRQELPQRDHPRQLHLPHPRVRADGDGVLRQARRGRGVAPVLDRRAHPLVRRPRHQPRQPAPLRARAGEAQPLLQAHRRHRVPLQLRRLGVGRARGHRQPHRLRPQDALRALRHRPVVLRPGRQRALLALRHRAGGRSLPQPDDLPGRRLHRGRGAQHQGRASTSAPCSSSTRDSPRSRSPCCR